MDQGEEPLDTAETSEDAGDVTDATPTSPSRPPAPMLLDVQESKSGAPAEQRGVKPGLAASTPMLFDVKDSPQPEASAPAAAERTPAPRAEPTPSLLNVTDAPAGEAPGPLIMKRPARSEDGPTLLNINVAPVEAAPERKATRSFDPESPSLFNVTDTPPPPVAKADEAESSDPSTPERLGWHVHGESAGSKPALLSMPGAEDAAPATNATVVSEPAVKVFEAARWTHPEEQMAARLKGTTTRLDAMDLVLVGAAGGTAALMAAGLFGAVGAVTGHVLPFLAIFVGLMVGPAVRSTAGEAHDLALGIIGGVLALLGGTGGYLFTVFAAHRGVGSLSGGDLIHQLTSAGPLTFVMLLIATYLGYTFSLRPVSTFGRRLSADS